MFVAKDRSKKLSWRFQRTFNFLYWIEIELNSPCTFSMKVGCAALLSTFYKNSFLLNAYNTSFIFIKFVFNVAYLYYWLRSIIEFRLNFNCLCVETRQVKPGIQRLMKIRWIYKKVKIFIHDIIEVIHLFCRKRRKQSLIWKSKFFMCQNVINWKVFAFCLKECLFIRISQLIMLVVNQTFHDLVLLYDLHIFLIIWLRVITITNSC